MADLDPAHVEAVAQVLMAPRMFTNMSGDKQRYDAAAILTSTDPDVHAALLAALVRAGVLEETVDRGHNDGSAWWSCARHRPGFECDPDWSRRRYVTRWEDVT